MWVVPLTNIHYNGLVFIYNTGSIVGVGGGAKKGYYLEPKV